MATEIRVQLAELGLFSSAEPPDFRVKMTITRHSSGRLDYDGLVGGCKLLIDVLRREGLMRDDSESWCEMHFAQAMAPKGKGYTEILLEEFGPPICMRCLGPLSLCGGCKKRGRKSSRKAVITAGIVPPPAFDDELFGGHRRS
jgi:hypothetical protein